MPKAGGTGTRSSVRAAEKAALEAEQAAAVVDAERRRGLEAPEARRGRDVALRSFSLSLRLRRSLPRGRGVATFPPPPRVLVIGEGRSPSGRRRQLKTLLQWRALWWERCIGGGGARWW